MKYSLIIPVYNAEKTLERCVNSIVKQSFSDYELILVDDGSSDKSFEMCVKYEREYNNIRALSKKNGGASSARNAGIEAAQGDYILFADSDDYVSDNYFSEICGAELPGGLAVFSYSKKSKKNISDKKIPGLLTDENADFFSKTKTLILSRLINELFSKIFDRELIEKNALRFDERMPVAEDFNFCLAYLMKCKDVSVKSTPVYIYDATNANSLVRKKKDGLIDIYPTVFNTAFETIKRSGFSAAQKCELYRIWDKLHTDSFATCVMEEFKDENKSGAEIRKEIKSMCNKFYSEYPCLYGYQNAVHFAVRFCIKYKLSGALYFLGRLYVKLRGRGLV